MLESKQNYLHLHAVLKIIGNTVDIISVALLPVLTIIILIDNKTGTLIKAYAFCTRHASYITSASHSMYADQHTSMYMCLYVSACITVLFSSDSLIRF